MTEELIRCGTRGLTEQPGVLVTRHHRTALHGRAIMEILVPAQPAMAVLWIKGQPAHGTRHLQNKPASSKTARPIKCGIGEATDRFGVPATPPLRTALSGQETREITAA